MNKLVFILVSWMCLRAEIEWTSEQEIVLKRNEVYGMKILIGVNDVRELKFHWTLFVDGGLVFLAKYDSFNHQMILYQDYKKNAMRLDLNKEKKGKSPYVVVFFQSYDSKKQNATFKVVTYGDVFVQ